MDAHNGIDQFFVTAFPKNSLLLLAAIMSQEYRPCPVATSISLKWSTLRAYAVFPTDIAGQSGFVLSVTELYTGPVVQDHQYAKSASLESRFDLVVEPGDDRNSQD